MDDVEVVIVVNYGKDVVEEAVVRIASEQLRVEGSCPEPTRHRGRPTVEKTGKLQPCENGNEQTATEGASPKSTEHRRRPPSRRW